MSCSRARSLALAGLWLFLAGGCGDGASAGDASAEDAPAGDASLPDGGPGEDAGLALPVCTTTVAAAFEIANIAPPGAGSDDYEPTSSSERQALAASIRALLGNEPGAALAAATDAGYELCRGVGEEDGVALWRPAAVGTGRALIAWRSRDARPLILGAPHAYFDSATLPEGVAAFFELDARALVASGTHRCASTTASSCDGTTSVCGGADQPYPISDMAHSVDTGFQVAHEVLAGEYTEDWVVSLHGMSGDGISLSDGTTLPSAAGQPVALLGAALMAEFPDEPITSCNSWPGAVVEERLCGTTNVQGRLVNGSAEPCGQAASASAGRFLHMEQSTTVRAAREKVLQAIADALP